MAGTRTCTRILVVDDDVLMRRMLKQYFTDEGFEVVGAANGSEMRAAMATHAFDIVLLDLVLPGESSGLDLAREIRASSDVPLVMLTGKDDVLDKVIGLEVGADDYICKPFHLREVHARLNAILRRRRAGTSPAAESATVTTFEGWRLDHERRRLWNPLGIEVALSTGEFDMLHVFVTHPGRVLTRDMLMDLTRNRSREGFDRTIDSQIVRLRRKIENDPKKPILIKSVRGVGYVFTAKPAAPSIGPDR